MKTPPSVRDHAKLSSYLATAKAFGKTTTGLLAAADVQRLVADAYIRGWRDAVVDVQDSQNRYLPFDEDYPAIKAAADCRIKGRANKGKVRK